MSPHRPGGRRCPGPGPPAWGAATCCWCCCSCRWCCCSCCSAPAGSTAGAAAPAGAGATAGAGAAAGAWTSPPAAEGSVGMRCHCASGRAGCSPLREGAAPASVSAIARQGHCPRKLRPVPPPPRVPRLGLTLPFGRPCAPLSLALLPPARARAGREGGAGRSCKLCVQILPLSPISERDVFNQGRVRKRSAGTGITE